MKTRHPARLLSMAVTLLMLFTIFGLAATPGSAAPRPDLRLRPDDGPPGITSQARGKHFTPNANGSIIWVASGQTLAAFTADTDGRFTVPFVIPAAPAGDYAVAAVAGDQRALDEFEIQREDAPNSQEASMETDIVIPSAVAMQTQSACPERGTRVMEVHDAVALDAALADAQPGDVILLAEGSYLGTFSAESSGAPDARITLCGSRGATIDGGDSSNGYALHITGDYWTIHGITVTNALKGVMLDGANHTQLLEMSVHTTGHEAVHFRANSSDNVIADSEIHTTGLKRDKFGEGVYIGSAVSNWSKYSGGEPDRSDRNQVLRNVIWNTSSESVDVKEGTTGGLIEGNVFSGDGLTGADSWVDVKGNAYVIRGNTGRDSPKDGFQTHVINNLDWGKGNVFESNVAVVNGDGFGFYIHDPETSGNVVRCNSLVTGAEDGFANVACT
jgi:hypothetical protein